MTKHKLKVVKLDEEAMKPGRVYLRYGWVVLICVNPGCIAHVRLPRETIRALLTMQGAGIDDSSFGAWKTCPLKEAN